MRCCSSCSLEKGDKCEMNCNKREKVNQFFENGEKLI